MTGQWLKLLIISLIPLVLIIACAPTKAPVSPEPAAAIPSVETATPTKVSPSPGIPPGEAWQQKWESLVEAARREGTVVVYGSTGAEGRRAMVSGFKAKYGMTVEIVTGRGAEVAEKVLTERRAGLYTVDVYVGGTTNIVGALKPAGALDKLEPVLILPELTDPQEIKKVWWNGELLWVDRGHYVLACFAAPAPPTAINTDLVKLEEVKSLQGLLAPKWKGKMTINDPTVPGFGAKWFAAAASHIVSPDYMRQLAKQEPVVMRDQRLQVEWLAHGKYPIAICPKSDTVADFLRAGARLAIVTPSEGAHLSSGSGNVALVNKAPHPNAAKLFINWVLTKEGQTLFSQAQFYPSAREDVTTQGIPPAKLREPGAKYFNAEDETFLVDEEPKLASLAKEIFGPLIK